MEEIKLDLDKTYRLTKIHPDGRYEVKITGWLQNPDGIIKTNMRCNVGRGLSSYWSTSWVMEIEKVHSGIRLTTENSIYLLEEYEPSSQR